MMHVGHALEPSQFMLAQHNPAILTEVVGASCDRAGASGSKGRGQEADMSGLIVGEGLDLAIEDRIVTCTGELSCMVSEVVVDG